MTAERRSAERLVFRAICLTIGLIAVRWLLPQIWDKLSPFIIALPLAAMMQKPMHFLHRRLKMKPGISSLLLVILMIILMFWIGTWLFSVLTEQVTQIVGQSGDFISSAVADIRQAANNFMANTASNFSPDFQDAVRRAMNSMVDQAATWGSQLATHAVSFSVSLVAGIPYGMIYISFLAIGLYFIANQYEEIRSYLPGGKRRRPDSNTSQLTNSALSSLSGYLRVQLTFSFIAFVFSWIYLTCFQFQYASLISLIAAVMEMIPMVGSGLLYILMAIIAFLGADSASGFQLLILTGSFQLIRRIIEPRLMANSMRISPLQSLIGMFVGMRLGGVMGLICGPVLMSVLVGAFHGRRFDLTMLDIHRIVAWFRKRWKEDPKALRKEEAEFRAVQPSDPSPDPASPSSGPGEKKRAKLFSRRES